jgi:phosphate acyltransferase
MGGDFAPRATVAGALHALSELEPEHTVQLVGRSAEVEAVLNELAAGELAHLAEGRRRITMVDAPDVIEMNDRPSVALRSKQQSSMVVGLRMQTEGTSDAFISAGNTGAQMAASTVLLKLHPGLTRPAISTLFPTSKKPVVVLDSGANVDCAAQELVQFARLGAVYAETILGRTRPAVGLLSIGEEPEKGNAVVKEANQLLAASGLNFIGNVEGRDLPAGGNDRGPIDVVICDGFVGNVILKLYEAIGPMMADILSRSEKIDRAALDEALRTLDYSEYGGAPLLGVRGVSIIAHGKSSPRAIKNAIKVCARAVETDMNAMIGKSLGAAAAAADSGTTAAPGAA